MSKKLIESKISIAKNKSAEIQALKSAGIISGSQFDEAVASFMTAIFELTIGFEIKSENPAEKISKRFKLGKKFKSADIPTLKLIASMLKDIKTDTVIGSNDITSDEDDEDDMDIKLPDDTSKLVPVTSADVETLSKKERMFMVMSIILECRDISIEDIMTLSASAEVYRKYLTTRNTIVIASASTLAVAGQ